MASVQQSLPLPPKPTMYEIWREYWPEHLRAYNRVFNAEQYATRQAVVDPNVETRENVTLARICGYLLVDFFNWRTILTEEPCNRLSKELLKEDQGSGENTVFNVGRIYRDHLLRLLWISSISRPPPTMEDISKCRMNTDSKIYVTAKDKALARDGYRCLLTGFFDEKCAREVPGLRKTSIHLRAPTTAVEACRILKGPASQGVDTTGGTWDGRVMEKTTHVTAVMSTLIHFGLKNIVQGFTENGVDWLGNILSLEHTCAMHFDSLSIWFEPTQEPDRYEVCVSQPNHKFWLRRFGFGRLERDDHERLFVTFSRADNSECPDPRLLALHAACARAAHMSGVAEAFDEVEFDLEDAKVLAHDGSSGHLLDHLLKPFVVISGVA